MITVRVTKRDPRAQVPEYTVADPYSQPVVAAGTSTSPTQLASPTAWYCHTERPQTQLKLLGSYTVPKIALQISSTLQSIPGPEIGAFFTATNALIAPSVTGVNSAYASWLRPQAVILGRFAKVGVQLDF